MNPTLLDEVSSINAIYGDDTMQSQDDSIILRLPSSGMSMRVLFPGNYPESSPKIAGPAASGDLPVGQAHLLVHAVERLLGCVFVAGQPCMYDLLEEWMSSGTAPPEDVAGISPSQVRETHQSEPHPEKSAVAPEWVLSDAVTEKKSVFVGRATKITSRDEARQFVKHFVSTDKQAAKATHNIVAWRYLDGSTSSLHHDCDDDGESAAGSRLLGLLELLGVKQGLVIVSRYYGGVHLGPLRFKLINAVARDALIRGNLVK